MPKLTDTQLVILSAAARREGGAALPLPESLTIKGGAVTTTLDGLRKKGLLKEKPAARDAAAWRAAKNGCRMTLVVTEAGLRAINAAPARQPGKQLAMTKPRPKNRGGRAERTHTRSKPKGKESRPVRRGTKQALLIDLLKRKSGATIDEIVKAAGWQPHSVRGAISGTLKKKLSLTVISATVERRGRVCRIVARG